MARRVNTRFVVIMCAVLVVLIGGAIMLALRVQKTFAEHMAMGDEALQEAVTLREAGDIKSANIFYTQAWGHYGNAFGDDPTRPEVLQQMVDVHYQYVCTSVTEANNRIDEIMKLLKVAYEHNAATSEDRLRFLETLTRFHRERLQKDGAVPWASIINRVTTTDVVNDPEDHLARRYLALTGVLLYRADMRDNEREEIRLNLDAALAHAPNDPQLLTALATFQLNEAQRLAKVQDQSPAVIQLYDDAAESVRQALAAESIAPNVHISAIGVGLLVPDERIEMSVAVEHATALTERLQADVNARNDLMAPELTQYFNLMQYLSGKQQDPSLSEAAMVVVLAVAKDRGDRPDIRLACARALSTVGDQAQAIEQVKAGLALDGLLDAEMYLLHLINRVELLALSVRSEATLAEQATDPAQKQAHLDAAERALKELRDAEGGATSTREALADFYAGRLDTIRNRHTLALQHLGSANRVFNNRHFDTLRLIGINQERAGNLGGAATAYETALGLQNNPDIRLRLIELYFRQGSTELAKAPNHIERFVEQRPEDPRGYLARAQYLNLIGQPEEAAAIIQSMDIEANPGLVIYLARYRAQAGQTDLAIALLRERLATEPTDRMAMQQLFNLLPDNETRLTEIDRLVEEGGMEQEQAEDLRKALELSGSNDLASQEQLIEELTGGGVRTQLRLVELYRQRGEADMAREQLAKAAAEYPNDPSVLEAQFNLALEDGDQAAAMALIDKMLALPEFDRPEIASDPALLRVMAQASAYAKEGGQNDATRQQLVTDYRKAMANNPNTILGWLQLGQLLGAGGQWAEARDAAQRAYELQPANLRAIILYAQVLANTGEFARSVKLLEDASRANPNNVMLRNQYLAYAQQAGYNDLVLAERERVRDALPTDLNNRRQLAVLYLRLDRANAALAEAEAVIAAEGLTVQNALLVARARVGLEQPELARSIFEQYLADRSEDATAQDHILFARLLLQLDDLESAQAAYEQAKAKDTSDNYTVSRLFASDLLQTGRYVESARLLRELTALQPEDNALRMALAQALLAAGALDEARSAATATAPSAEQALILHDIEIRLNRPDAARAILEQAYRDYPTNDRVALAFGRTMLALNQPAKAAPAIRGLAQRQAASPDVQLVLAQLELAEGQRDAARSRLIDLTQRAPDLLLARQELFNLLRQDTLAQAPINPARSRELANQALEVIAPLADRQPESEPANRLAGEAANLAGQPARAVVYYDRALTQSATDENLLELARSMISAGQPADAVALLQAPEYASLLEESLMLRATWGWALARAGQEQAAVNLFTNLLRDNQAPAQQSVIAQIACTAFPGERGVELVDTALGDNGSAQIDRTLAQIESVNLLFEQVLARLDKYEASPPPDADLRADLLGQLGLACQQTGDYERAKRVYEAALQDSPDSVELLNNLAYLLSDNLQGYEQQALAYAKRAVKLTESSQVSDLDRALILDTLGWAQFRAGQGEEAIQTLTLSTQLQPVYANLSHLGRVYAAMGNSDRAYNTLLQARDEARRSNNSQQIDEATRYLSELDQ